MEAINLSKELHRFLEAVVERKPVETAFLNDYEACVLPPNHVTPFSDVVGLRSNFTVIFNRKKLRRSSMNSGISPLDELNITGLENGDLSANTVPASFSEEREFSGTNDFNELPSSPYQVVPIGQPLSNKRHYLCSSSYLHEQNANSFGCCSSSDNLLPLSLSSSRYLISLFSVGSWSNKKSLPDVWTVCEKNLLKIVALGCQYDPDSSTMRVITIKEDDNPWFELLDNGGRKYCSAFCEYEITTTEPSNKNGDFFEKIILQFSWNDPEISVLAPPPDNSDAVLNVCSTSGHLFSPLLPVFQELKSLHNLCLIAAGKAKWEDSENEDVLGSTKKRTQLIKGFIEDMANPLASVLDVTVISPPCSHTIYEARTNLDFVERLWNFCHSVFSYEELKLIFAEVFKAIILGNLQPFIHRKSSSTLAGLLRQVLVNRDRETIQDLTVKLQLLLSETRLIPCLIQIGLEKLRGDYSAFFSGADLLSSDYFEHFFGASGNLSHLDQCVQLCKIHSIAELDCSLMKTLKLPTPVLSSFTKSAMEVYKKDASYQPFSKSPVFSLSLPAYSQSLKSVAALCSKLSPDTWKLYIQSTSSSNAHSQQEMILKRVRPLVGYLQNLEPVSPHYSYEASCELIPLN